MKNINKKFVIACRKNLKKKNILEKFLMVLEKYFLEKKNSIIFGQRLKKILDCGLCGPWRLLLVHDYRSQKNKKELCKNTTVATQIFLKKILKNTQI